MVNYLPTLEACKSGILCLIWKAQFYNTVTACSHQVQEQNSCVTALYLSSYVPDIVLDFPKQYFVITERNINLSFYEDFIKLSNIDKYNTVNRRKKKKVATPNSFRWCSRRVLRTKSISTSASSFENFAVAGHCQFFSKWVLTVLYMTPHHRNSMAFGVWEHTDLTKTEYYRILQ